MHGIDSLHSYIMSIRIMAISTNINATANFDTYRRYDHVLSSIRHYVHEKRVPETSFLHAYIDISEFFF